MVAVEREQIGIAGDDDLGLGGECAVDDVVVVRVAYHHWRVSAGPQGVEYLQFNWAGQVNQLFEQL